MASFTALLIAPALAIAANAHGYDVSWPQCGESLPVDGEVRIVGVNGGKPYEDNPCLAEQYRWASGAPTTAFYMNTSNPGTASRVVDWYNQKSPNALCSRNDEAACAYNYGYNAAKHAFATAQRETGNAGRHMWWLDVETENSWSSDTSLNAADILGSIAYLRSQGVPVGVYSTGYQWGKIAGGASLPEVPNWVAGARNRAQAETWCGPDRSFTGGPVLLVQWVEHDLDHDHVCAPLPAVSSRPLPGPSGPAGLDVILEDLLSLNLPKLLQDLGLAPR
ncbi:MAG: hypothetical protein ACLGI2_07225 [Acidimicrobiia bacterium]